MELNWPLMENNIPREDLDAVIDFLKDEPILTQNKNVRAFEEQWGQWLGTKYNVFINSGSSANQMCMAILKELYGEGEVIVPCLTWVSDIASVIQAGLTPVFVDCDPDHLGMAEEEIKKKVTDKTRAVFLTYVQGFNALSDSLLAFLEEKNIPLIEDVCESHGATHKGKRLGSFGLMSCFSFYFAHHMSTIEGGMVCTNDEKIYQMARMMRSHGMVREVTDESLKQKYKDDNPELNPDFIFAYPSWNFRNNEIGGVLGQNQLKRLDANNVKRNKNHKLFLDNLDSNKYKTDFVLEGSSNYAFNLILKQEPLGPFCDRVMAALKAAKVEFRRGSAGGGNQVRQPYVRKFVRDEEWLEYPNVEHVHFYAFYIGNFPDLKEEKILKLCELLNSID